MSSRRQRYEMSLVKKTFGAVNATEVTSISAAVTGVSSWRDAYVKKLNAMLKDIKAQQKPGFFTKTKDLSDSEIKTFTEELSKIEALLSSAVSIIQ